MQPTLEQQAALDLFKLGDSMVIEAGAGTGKTSTLVLLAESTPRKGQYLAFNKAIVNDVKGKLPESSAARTAHSLAFRAVGRHYSHRLNAPRMASRILANMLDVGPFVVTFGKDKKVLQPGYLASWIMRAVSQFCASVDEKPSAKHFPYIDGIDVPTPEGKRTYMNNDAVRAEHEVKLLRAWEDISRKDGQLPFKHDHYLKLWHLSEPRIPVDYVLFDEAQDADPVMADIVAMQTHAQRVFVGDSQQAIYEWRGAVNAMEGFGEEHRRMLTQSFRFGSAIADVANDIMEELAAPLRLTGLDSIESTVGGLGDRKADAVLCRTNAMAVTTVLNAQRSGGRPALVGGGSEVVAFARAARDLQEKGQCYHPEIACFESWGEVKEYVRSDPQGSDLKLMVDLIDEFGIVPIIETLERMPREDNADLIVSTAHKAKGREWPVVRLANDFAGSKDRAQARGEEDVPKAELRLQYVACTRAKQHLDKSALEDGYVDPETVSAPEIRS